MTQDPAAIAGKLSAAQKRAILSAWQDSPRHAPYHVFPNTKENRAAWRSLIGLGFVTEEHPGHDLVYQRGRSLGLVGISDLGLSVRQILEEQDRGE